MDAVAAYDLTKEYEGLRSWRRQNLQVPQGRPSPVWERGAAGKPLWCRLLSGLVPPHLGGV